MAENLRGLRDIRHYRKYIQTFDRVKTIRSGYIYSYIYKSLEYPFKIIRWFDLMPICFVFGVNYKSKRFYGLNYHHLPVRTRLIWLARVKRLLKAKFPKKNSKNYDIPKRLPLSYRRLMLILQNTKFGVRQYRFQGVRDLRIIPNSSFDQAFKYYANTYYAVSYKQKTAAYNKWKKK